MIICQECGKFMNNIKSGVLVIHKNGSMQFADRWSCPMCNKTLFTGFSGHVKHTIKDETKIVPRYYVATREYIT